MNDHLKYPIEAGSGIMVDGIPHDNVGVVGKMNKTEMNIVQDFRHADLLVVDHGEEHPNDMIRMWAYYYGAGALVESFIPKDRLFNMLRTDVDAYKKTVFAMNKPYILNGDFNGILLEV